MDYGKQLGLSSDEFNDLFDNFEKRKYKGRKYFTLPDIRKGIEKGTVLVDGRVIRGYPKTPRVFVLKKGLKSYFDDKIAIEEKMNGYNLRIALIDGEIFAFTRSGYICPFSTSLVKEKMDLDSFFSEYSDYMLCGEIIGPENPYTSHSYPEVDSIDIQIFDIRKNSSGKSMNIDKRKKICEKFDIKQVRFFGEYKLENAVEKAPKIIDRLNKQNREGIVMKSIDGKKQLKYTTKNTHQDDLSHAFSIPFDYGQDFVFSRIIREAFQSVEWDENYKQTQKRAHELGESILLPFINSIRQVSHEKTVGEHHIIRGKPKSVSNLLEHLRDQGLSIKIIEDKNIEDKRVVFFIKESHSTTDKIKHYLEGGKKDI